MSCEIIAGLTLESQVYFSFQDGWNLANLGNYEDGNFGELKGLLFGCEF
jgi:hypothetical protein